MGLGVDTAALTWTLNCHHPPSSGDSITPGSQCSIAQVSVPNLNVDKVNSEQTLHIPRKEEEK